MDDAEFFARELIVAASQVESDVCRQGLDWEETANFLRRVASFMRFPPKPPSVWFTPVEAAAYAKCSPRTLETYRREGGGPVYHRQGSKWVVYHRDDLDAWRAQGRASNTTAERLGGVRLNTPHEKSTT